MRAIVIDPPRFGVPAFWAWPAPRAVAAAAPRAAVPASARNMRGRCAFTLAPSGGDARQGWKGRVYSTQPLLDKANAQPAPRHTARRRPPGRAQAALACGG